MNNGWLQAGYGAAYAYAAKTGVIKTSEMDNTHRMFLTSGFLVTPDTMDEYRKTFVENAPAYDYNGSRLRHRWPHVLICANPDPITDVSERVGRRGGSSPAAHPLFYPNLIRNEGDWHGKTSECFPHRFGICG